MKKDAEIKLSQFQLNNENPFLKQALEQIEKNTVKKYKSATRTGEGAILKAYDEKSGEILGHTSFIRQIEVDEEQFAKVYMSGFSAFFDLKQPAIKVFSYILTQLIPSKDEFVFIIEDCLKHTGYKTKSSIYSGLAQLVECEIIARGKKDILYYINPMVVFNGNRLTFAKSYIKKKGSQEKELKEKYHQTTLDEQIEKAEQENKLAGKQ